MDKSSCKKYIVYFLILCLLITLCNTQKGGGKSKGSSSRSSSKSRRSRSELSFFFIPTLAVFFMEVQYFVLHCADSSDSNLW